MLRRGRQSGQPRGGALVRTTQRQTVADTSTSAHVTVTKEYQHDMQTSKGGGWRSGRNPHKLSASSVGWWRPSALSGPASFVGNPHTVHSSGGLQIQNPGARFSTSTSNFRKPGARGRVCGVWAQNRQAWRRQELPHRRSRLAPRLAPRFAHKLLLVGECTTKFLRPVWAVVFPDLSPVATPSLAQRSTAAVC